MEIHWKTVAIFGGIGFFLSLLVGAVSGVSFGTVLLRGVVSAAVFGGIGLGLHLLIKKYLPGLVEGTEGEDEAFADEPGSGVDIVIEEEAPRNLQETSGSIDYTAEEDIDESMEGSSFVEEVEEASSEDLASAADAGGDESGKGDQDEAAGGTAAAAAAALEAGEEDEAEEAEEVEELQEAGTAGTEGDIDSLPDIGDFSGSFSTGGDDSEEGENSAFQSSDFSGGGNAPVEILGQEESPETVAKAVQTMLKKE